MYSSPRSGGPPELGGVLCWSRHVLAATDGESSVLFTSKSCFFDENAVDALVSACDDRRGYKFRGEAWYRPSLIKLATSASWYVLLRILETLGELYVSDTLPVSTSTGNVSLMCRARSRLRRATQLRQCVQWRRVLLLHIMQASGVFAWPPGTRRSTDLEWTTHAKHLGTTSVLYIYSQVIISTPHDSSKLRTTMHHGGIHDLRKKTHKDSPWSEDQIMPSQRFWWFYFPLRLSPF